MLRNPLFYMGLGAIAVLAAILVNLISDLDDETASNAPAPAVQQDPPRSESKTADKSGSQTQPAANTATEGDALPLIPPSFDVVRVTPTGDAVIAGRAGPGDTVIIRDGLSEIGRVVADDKGEWVYLPGNPLPPGNRQLSLESITPNGERIKSDDVVVLVVPEHGDAPALAAGERTTEPLAILVPREGTGPSRLIQGDSPEKIVFTVSAIDYAPDGNIIFSGDAPSGDRVKLSIDKRPMGETTADGDSRWSLTVTEKLKPGVHKLTARHETAAGELAHTVELPFVQEKSMPRLDKEQQIVVQPGNSLWRIARRVYGGGVHYTIIYKANKAQIDDPDLIYPGQIFEAPPKTN